MEVLEEQSQCDICGKRGRDLSRLSANHKELGLIMVCQECWIRLYDENQMVSSSTGSSSTSPCSTCSNSSCRL